MSDSPVSVGAALGYAWSLWRTHWREIWGALALNGLAWTVAYAGVFTGNGDIGLAGQIGLLMTTYPVYGAVMRLAFAADHPDDPEFRLGSLGLQWRRMELRLFLANLLLVAFLALVLIVAVGLVIVLLGAVLAAKLAGHGPITPAMMKSANLSHILGPDLPVVAVTVVLFVLLFFIVRLGLYAAATADSRKIVVMKTWNLLRGHFFQFFAATMVLSLPTMLIMGVGGGAGLPLAGQPSPLGPGETFIYSLICGAWAGAAAMPLSAGVQAYFYRNLKTDV